MMPQETQHVTGGTEGGLIRTCMKMALDGWMAHGRVERYHTPQGYRLSIKLIRDTVDASKDAADG